MYLMILMGSGKSTVLRSVVAHSAYEQSYEHTYVSKGLNETAYGTWTQRLKYLESSNQDDTEQV